MNYQTEPLLIVDDEKPILDSISRILRKYPFQLATALSARQAMELMEEKQLRPKVVISDQRMPGISGVEFLKWVREHHPEIVRVLLTGYGDLETAKQAINLGGIYRYLEKPWDEKELIQTVQEGVNLYNLLKMTQIKSQELEKGLEKRERKIKQLRREITELNQTYQELSKEYLQLWQDLFKFSFSGPLQELSRELEFILNNRLTSLLLNLELLLSHTHRESVFYQGLRAMKRELEEIQAQLKDFFSFQDLTGEKNRCSLNKIIYNTICIYNNIYKKRNIEYGVEMGKIDPLLENSQLILVSILLQVLSWLSFQLQPQAMLRLRSNYSPKTEKITIKIVARGIEPGKKVCPETLLSSNPLRSFLYLSKARAFVKEESDQIIFYLKIPYPCLRISPKGELT